MSHRIEQVNELLRSELAVLVSREIPLDNGLVTVSYVDCSPDLRYAKVGISVLPENVTGTALGRLKNAGGSFNRELGKKLKMRRIPRFRWVIDERERNAAKIEETLRLIHDNDRYE